MILIFDILNTNESKTMKNSYYLNKLINNCTIEILTNIIKKMDRIILYVIDDL
jgi:hypothetical protein